MKALIEIPKRFNNFLKSYWFKNPLIGIRRILFFYLVILIVLCLVIVSNELLSAMLSLFSIIVMTIYFFRQWRNFGYYHRLKEFEDLGEIIELRDYILPKNFSENKRELLVKDKEIFYTKVFLDCKREDSASYNYCRLLADLFFSKGPKSCLILGGGGGAVPLLITKNYPKAKIEVVEISPAMIDVAKRYFFLPRKVKFINQDAFEFVKKTRRKYDFVFVDIFVGNRLPEHFLDDKFVGSLKHVTKEEGIIVVNTGKDMRFTLRDILKKFRKTLLRTYPLLSGEAILVCRKNYTKFQLLKLSQKARFKEEINKFIDKAWLGT